MTPPSQVEDVAPLSQLPDFHPMNFNLTTRDGLARYQDFCSQFSKKLREWGLQPGWQQWEREVDCFVSLLRHNLPKSLRLAQVKNRELQADCQVCKSSPLILRVRNGIKDLLDDETRVSSKQALQTNLAKDLLIELFGGWDEAQEHEPHGHQLVEILLALGVRPPDAANRPKEDGPGLAREVEVPETLHEISSVMASIDAGQAAQERRGHGDNGHEGPG